MTGVTRSVRMNMYYVEDLFLWMKDRHYQNISQITLIEGKNTCQMRFTAKLGHNEYTNFDALLNYEIFQYVIKFMKNLCLL